MHKFLVRAASGIIYAAVIILAITYGGWALWVMAAAFATIGICELDRMAIGYSRTTLPIYILDILGVLSLLCIAVTPYAIILWIILDVIRIFAARNVEADNPDMRKAPRSGQIYLGIPFAFMLGDPIQRLALLIFVMLWLNDSGAYITGSLMGRHKLCPKISPKKTWEGFIGGVVITLAGTWALAAYCPSFFGMEQFGIVTWLLLAVVACIFGTLGDLLESKIKRTYGVKDSGNWIPGHGGLLDRIDSFLIAYPVAFLLLAAIS